MASKPKGKSKLLKKLGKLSKGGWKRSREVEPQAKGAQLPGGIIRGVAKLTSYKFAEDKKGNPYFFLTGVVCEPENLRGAKATMQHFIKETQHKSVQDKLDGLSSDLQLLGAQLEGTDLDDLPGIIADLVKEKPNFYFNTASFTGDDGQARTYVFIQGLAEDWEGDDKPELEDEGDGDEGEGEPEEVPEDDAEPEDEGEGDGDDDSEGDDEDWEPEKKEVYLYKSTPKGKSKEVEIKGVNKKAKTVTAKRVEDGKVFKDVGWDKLEGG